MSSDLWAAFGAGSEEPVSSNPRETNNSPPLEVHENNKFKPDTQNSPWVFQDQEQDHPKAVDNNHDSDADSWSDVNRELDAAWVQPVKQTTLAAHSTPYNITTGNVIVDDEDDFGDFEDPEDQIPTSIKTTTNRTVQAPHQDTQIEDDFGDFEDADESVHAEEQTRPIDLTEKRTVAEQPTGNRMSLKPPSKPSANESYDPFTELEKLSQPTHKGTIASQQPSRSSHKPSAQERRAPLIEGIVMAEVHPDPNEEWDDWSDQKKDPTKDVSSAVDIKSGTGDTEQGKAVQANNIASKKPWEISKTEDDPVTSLPPTNVPPPSILMPLVASIVQDLPGEIESLLQSHEDYQGGISALSQAITLLTALEDRVAVIKVAARIIAGRKLRWKRDTILAQSMSIGAAGRQGGMKLVGVDKAEVKREDREATEFVRMWSKNQGRMRSALMKLPAQVDEKPPALPFIAEKMVVRTLKDGEGGIKAPRSCVVCGLKRDERVEKVDLDVWDQFGEWWIEFWGHTECRTFWNTHEQFLQQR